MTRETSLTAPPQQGVSFGGEAIEAECVALRRSHPMTIPLPHQLCAARAIPRQIAGVDQEHIRCILAFWHGSGNHEGGHTRPAAHDFVAAYAPHTLALRDRGG